MAGGQRRQRSDETLLESLERAARAFAAIREKLEERGAIEARAAAPRHQQDVEQPSAHGPDSSR